MIFQKVGPKTYLVKAESSYDLMNLSLVLFKSDVFYFQKQRVRKEDEEKKDEIKPKKVRICLNQVSATYFSNLDSLEIKGQFKNKPIFKTLKVNQEFFIVKRLQKNTRKFLNNLDQEKTYYLGVDVGVIQFGYSKNYEFTELYRKEFSFKNINYKKQLLSVLDKLKPYFKDKPIFFKCLLPFIKDFNRWTNYNWIELKRDVSLDWESCISAKIKENKLIQYFLRNKKNWVLQVESLIQELDLGNINCIYINPMVSMNLYNQHILKKLLLNKIKIVPYTKDLSYLMSNGFIAFKYF